MIKFKQYLFENRMKDLEKIKDNLITKSEQTNDSDERQKILSQITIINDKLRILINV